MLVLINNTVFSNTFIQTQYVNQIPTETNRGADLSPPPPPPVINDIIMKIQTVLSDRNQPIIIKDIALVCVGDIYNAAELFKHLQIKPITASKYEIIIHLYKKYGLEYALKILDGAFAFCLIDYRICNKTSKMYIGTDTFGIYPLYLMTASETVFVLSQNIKTIRPYENHLREYFDDSKNIVKYNRLPPSSVTTFELSNLVSPKWHLTQFAHRYYSICWLRKLSPNQIYLPIFKDDDSIDKHFQNYEIIYRSIQFYFNNAIEKMCEPDKPIVCILDGGFANYLIAGLLANYCENKRAAGAKPPIVITYAAGFMHSDTLHEIQCFTKYLEIDHTEVLFTAENIAQILHEVVYITESFSSKTVEDNVDLYFVLRQIKEDFAADGDCHIFYGAGFSEIVCETVAPTNDLLKFDSKCIEVLEKYHKNGLDGVSKTFSHFGFTPKLPFLDRGFVEYFISLPPEIRFIGHENTDFRDCLIRSSFDILQQDFCAEQMSDDDDDWKPLIPEEILFRETTPIFDQYIQKNKIIDEYVNQTIPDNYDASVFSYQSPPTNAKEYMYRRFFECEYENMATVDA
jgi:asparagine synthase (glutamine-hydrolysing)